MFYECDIKYDINLYKVIINGILNQNENVIIKSDIGIFII